MEHFRNIITRLLAVVVLCGMLISQSGCTFLAALGGALVGASIAEEAAEDD